MPTSRPFAFRAFRRPLALLSVILAAPLAGCGAVAPDAADDAGGAPPLADTGTTPSSDAPDAPAVADAPVVPDATPTTPAFCTTTPRTLATVSGTLRRIESIAGGLLFTSGTRDVGTLTKLAIPSLVSTTLATAPQLALVGVDGDAIVWTAGTERTFHLGHLATGGDDNLLVRLADYQGSFSAPLLGVTASTIFWADGRKGMSSFLSMPLVGAAPDAHVLPAGGPSPETWIVADGAMFWSNGSGTWKAGTPDGALPVRIATSGTPIAAHAGVVYVTRPSSVGLEVDAIDAAGASKAIGTLTGGPSSACAGPGKYGLATVSVSPDARVYGQTWTDCMIDGSRVVSIARAEADATEPTELVSFRTHGVATDAPMALDASCLYWAENDGTTATLKTVAR